MPLTDVEALPSGTVPYSDCLVPRTGEECLAVWRKGDRIDPTFMSFVGSEALPGSDVICLDGVVF